MADMDDTAKIIFCLKSLGKDVSLRSKIETFAEQTHLKTYLTERNHSFSANCNDLLALLRQEVPQELSAHKLQISGFLCDSRWDSFSKTENQWVGCRYVSLSL